MKINSTILFMLVLPLFWQACTSNAENKTSEANKSEGAIPVKLLPIEKQNLSSVIQTSGTFNADNEPYLSFKIGGVIDKIYVKEGDKIRKGQLLASLNLTEINAQVAQAKLGLEKAERDKDRAEKLYRDSVATLEQFQNAQTGFEVARKQYDAALFNKTYAEIRAVEDGFVLRKLASEGQVVSTGNSVLQTNNAGDKNWKLKITLSDVQWAACRIGDRVKIETELSELKNLEGKITRKSETTDMASGAFYAEVSVNEKVNLASGLFAKAWVQTQINQQGWRIPYDALLDGDGGNGYVFTTQDKKTVQKTPVVIATIEKDFVVVQAGLEQAGYVVASGSAYLRQGSAIVEVK
ncbi:MAG: efflux RND transporter periplasmic adaptor subunit [Chryseotalea sp.]